MEIIFKYLFLISQTNLALTHRDLSQNDRLYQPELHSMKPDHSRPLIVIKMAKHCVLDGGL